MESESARVATPLRGQKRTRTILGFDIGGTKTAIVEATTQAEILQRREVPTNAELPFHKVFPGLASLAEKLIAEATRAGREVKALSVSVGGPLRIQEGILLNPPHLPGWHNVRLKERLAQKFHGLPVCIEHDGNAGALAEFRFGIGPKKPGVRNLVFLTFGTGLGAGLIVNGQVVHGASDTAGELGHWRLSDDGPMGYGKAGSWEGFASGAGLVQLASRMFPSRWSVKTPIRVLVEAMVAEEKEAIAVLTEAATWMGRGLALIVDAFNPEVIVLGSLAVLLGERVLAPARRVVAEEALPQAVAACEILPSALGLQIGDVAAVMAALNDPVARIALGCEALRRWP
jgi:glucokinase